MNFIIIAILTFMLAMCGCGEFDHNVKVSGQVEVKHTFTVEDAYNYFYKHCQIMYPAATEQELILCAQQSLDEWMTNNNVDTNP